LRPMRPKPLIPTLTIVPPEKLGRHGRLRWLPKARPPSSLEAFCRADYWP